MSLITQWVFPSPSIDGPRTTVQKPLDRIRADFDVSFTVHDLRRTAASKVASIGVPRDIVSKLLNHADKGVTRIYDRYSYDREKREAMDRWAEEVARILTDERSESAARVAAA